MNLHGFGNTYRKADGDHAGSASMTITVSGSAGNQMRLRGLYVLSVWGHPQREETAIGLYDYKARYYDPVIGRFIQADTIVPEPGNPQALNRYAYVYGNPLGYQDPDGHNPLPYLLLRGTYEAMTVVFPTMDRSRRDRIGGTLVTNVADTIAYQAETHSVDPVLVSSVLRHESSAVERRLLTLWPTMQPGIVANGAEWAQSIVKGDTASIGPGQMQLRRARELEEMGYVTPRSSTSERRTALLGPETSTEYVAGMLHYVNDQLNTLDGFSELGIEEQNRLTLIGYNWGWTDQFKRYLREKGLNYMIRRSPYDDETLDEYLRWKSEQ